MATKNRLTHGTPSLFNILDRTPLLDSITLLHESTEGQIEAFYQTWDSSSYVTLDLETTGEDTQAHGLNPFLGYIRLYQVGIKGNVMIVDSLKTPNHLLEKFLTELKRHCEGTQQVQIYHNAIFDLNWLRIQHGIRSRKVRDTMVMSKMLNAGIGNLSSNSLGDCVKRFLSVELDKSSQKDDWSVYELSNKQLNYAANDVIYTEKLFYSMVRELRSIAPIDMFGRPCERSFLDVVTTECDFIPVMSEIVATGQPVNIEYAYQVLKQYQDAIEDLYKPVLDKTGLTSTAQPAKLLEAIKRVYGVTILGIDGETETTSSDALFLAYCEHGIEDLMRISLTRTLAKSVTTLEKLILSAEQCGGYARGNYSSLGDTSSGRSTCKGKGRESSWECLNLQNIPGHCNHPMLDKYNLPKIRSVIQHKGYEKVMALYDLSSSHARYAAKENLSNDFKLVEVLELPDPHSYMTLQLGKLAGKDWDLEYYNANKKTDQELIAMRSVAKVGLYTQFNGGGAATFYGALLGGYQNVDFELCKLTQDALAIGFNTYTQWAQSAKWKVAKSSDTIQVKGRTFSRWLTPCGRLYHCEVYDRVSAKGNAYKTVKAGEVSSACLISAEAQAEKTAGTRAYYWLCDNSEVGDTKYQINGFCHDDYNISDFTEDKLFARYFYNCIAEEFTKSLGGVPSTMSPDDGNWVRGLMNNFSEK